MQLLSGFQDVIPGVLAQATLGKAHIDTAGNAPFFARAPRLSRHDQEQLEELVRPTIEKVIWNKAAQHHLGEGLESGADLTALKRTISWLGKQGRQEEQHQQLFQL